MSKKFHDDKHRLSYWQINDINSQDIIEINRITYR